MTDVPAAPPAPVWELVCQRGDWDTTERLYLQGDGWLYRTIITPHGASMEVMAMTMSFVAEPAAVDPGPPSNGQKDKLND